MLEIISLGKSVGMIVAMMCLVAGGVCSCGRDEAANAESEIRDRGPYIEVAIDYPHTSCAEVESKLAARVERTLMTCRGARIVATSCQRSLLTARVYFERKIDIAASLETIHQKMQQLRGALPADVGEGSVSVVREEFPVITVDVYGDLPIGELINAAEKLRPLILADLPDHVTAKVTGQKETHVNLETYRMVQHALSAGRVLERIRSLAEEMAPDELKAMVIKEPVLLGDIANFSPGYAGPTIRVDGKTCVEINFYAPTKFKAIAAAIRALKSADKNRSSLPENMQCKVYRTAEETTPKTVRLTVWESNPDFVAPLVRELEKLQTVESIRSFVSKGDSRIELTMKPNVRFQQALELVREECKQMVSVVESWGLDGGPMKLRAPPEKELFVAVERFPPQLLARIDLFANEDISVLRRSAELLSDRLRKTQGIGNVRMNGLLGLQERFFRPRVNTRMLDDLHISAEKVVKLFEELRSLNGQGEVVDVNGGSDIIRVFCRDKNVTGTEDIVRQLITTEDGSLIPLDAVMEIETGLELQEITRVDGVRLGSMEVYSDGTCDPAELIECVRSILDEQIDETGHGVEARLYVG